MATKWGNSAAQKINLCPIKHCNNWSSNDLDFMTIKWWMTNKTHLRFYVPLNKQKNYIGSTVNSSLYSTSYNWQGATYLTVFPFKHSFHWNVCCISLLSISFPTIIQWVSVFFQLFQGHQTNVGDDWWWGGGGLWVTGSQYSSTTGAVIKAEPSFTPNKQSNIWQLSP